MSNSLFERLFGGVRGNVRTSFTARWKALGRLPLFASSYGWYVISRYWSKSHSYTETIATWEVYANALSLWSSTQCVNFPHCFFVLYIVCRLIQPNIHQWQSCFAASSHQNSSVSKYRHHYLVAHVVFWNLCLSALFTAMGVIVSSAFSADIQQNLTH